MSFDFGDVPPAKPELPVLDTDGLASPVRRAAGEPDIQPPDEDDAGSPPGGALEVRVQQTPEPPLDANTPKNVKELVLVDWKRSKSPKKAAYRKQLNLYRYLLLKNYKPPDDDPLAEFEINDLYIVRLHPCSTSYDLVQVPVDENLAKEALRKQGLQVD